ncbi:MAG: hypothetical protein FWG89_00610 [Treponema sp.]|nr:hypothetical protein [Treponema sp.]
MKSNKKCGAILALVFLFGMMVFACGADQGGVLTITDIPVRFNGKYAVAEGDGIDLIGAQSVEPSSWSGTGARISNGRVSIPLWLEDRDTMVKYAGNHTLMIGVALLDSPSIDDWESIAELEFYSVAFSNGNAAVSFQDADYFYEYED